MRRMIIGAMLFSLGVGVSYSYADIHAWWIAKSSPNEDEISTSQASSTDPPGDSSSSSENESSGTADHNPDARALVDSCTPFYVNWLASDPEVLEEKYRKTKAVVDALLCAPVDRNGNSLSLISPVDGKNLEIFYKARVASEEDRDFFSRPCLPSKRGLQRAIWTRINPIRTAVGGSGEGQQACRAWYSIFDYEEAREQSLRRKADFWIISAMIDQYLQNRTNGDLKAARQLLLSLHARLFDFGIGLTDLEGASQRAFQKRFEELVPKQVVAIAAMLSKPNKFLFEDTEALEAKTNHLMSKMGLDTELINTPLELDPAAHNTARNVVETMARHVDINEHSCEHPGRIPVDAKIQEHAGQAMNAFLASPAVSDRYGSALRLAVVMADHEGLVAITSNSTLDVLNTGFDPGSLFKLALIDLFLREAPDLRLPTAERKIYDFEGRPYLARNYSKPPLDEATPAQIGAGSYNNPLVTGLGYLAADFIEDISDLLPKDRRYTSKGDAPALSAEVGQAIYGDHFALDPDDLGQATRFYVAANYTKKHIEAAVGEGELNSLKIYPSLPLGGGAQLTPAQYLKWLYADLFEGGRLQDLTPGKKSRSNRTAKPRYSLLGTALAAAEPRLATYSPLLRKPYRLAAKTGTSSSDQDAVLGFAVLIDGRPTVGFIVAWTDGEVALQVNSKTVARRRTLRDTDNGSRGLSGGALAKLARDLLDRIGSKRVSSPELGSI